MTEALYLNDAYLKEFDGVIKSVKDDKFIVLDKTAFYPNGGGQKNDTGKIIVDGIEYNVVFVGKFNGEISHEVDKPGLKEGDKVHGVIDWDRRYQMMMSHTAAHVIMTVFHKESEALITGNQLDIEKIRIDFNLEDFDREKIIQYLEDANKVLCQNLEVTSYTLPREEVEKDPAMCKLAKGFPPDIQDVRIVQIGDFDKQADGGTHVKNTSEIGKIEFIKAENKGKSNRRVYLKLV